MHGTKQLKARVPRVGLSRLLLYHVCRVQVHVSEYLRDKVS